MLSREFYNVVHIVGIILLMSALGAVAFHAMAGGTKAPNPARRLLASLHGAGAFLILLGGFGMLARVGFPHGGNFPGWLWVKIVVWTVLAVAAFLPYRRPQLALPLLLSLPLLGGLAAYMGIYKVAL